MTDEAEITALVASHRDHYGRLDVLVNNAGVGIGEAMHEITAKKLDIQIGANLRGVDPRHAESRCRCCARPVPSTARR